MKEKSKEKIIKFLKKLPFLILEGISWIFGLSSFILIFIGIFLTLKFGKNDIGGILINVGVGLATASMMVYVALQVREIRKDRDLSLRKEHTEELRKKVVRLWIEELKKISEAKKRISSITKNIWSR